MGRISVIIFIISFTSILGLAQVEDWIFESAGSEGSLDSYISSECRIGIETEPAKSLILVVTDENGGVHVGWIGIIDNLAIMTAPLDPNGAHERYPTPGDEFDACAQKAKSLPIQIRRLFYGLYGVE